MAIYKSAFIQEITARGFIHQATDIDNLDKILFNENNVPAYIGFDCTAPSLHVGSLIQIMLLRWYQRSGHQPIVLLGGGTTLVGDPSGKDESRKLLTNEIIEKNATGIKNVFEKFINFDKEINSAVMVNNAEWLTKLNYIDFLRDFGKHFSINRMLGFDSVKLRLDREQTLSFLEFNYMILQGYDFYELKKRYNCILQMGGSDQWGNIVSGIDLIRRMQSKKAYAITSPLITNNDGSKMGKTIDGAIWLDENKLGNYEFYQFWRNVEDTNVSKFLNYFTTLPHEEIRRLSKLKGKEINEAKKILAFEVTKITRGDLQAKEAEQMSSNIFTHKKTDNRLNTYSVKIKDIVDSSFTIIDAIEKLELVKSRSEIKRIINSNGIKINDESFNQNSFSLLNFKEKKEIKISVGKKKIGIIKII